MSRRKKVASFNAWEPETVQERRAALPDVAPIRRKKNTRVWCKGKKGVPHEWEECSSEVCRIRWYVKPGSYWYNVLGWRHFKCKRCGKQRSERVEK